MGQIHQADRTDWLDRLRNTRGYDLASRALGSAWFLLLGALAVRAGLSDKGTLGTGIFYAGGWPELLSHAGLVLFYLTLWLLVLMRPSPVARANGVLPNATALAGSYMPWLIVLFPKQELSGAGHVIATVLILGGNALTLIVVWHLGRSFSFLPQARKLVVTGPYSVIRHPLYLAEESMIFGTALLYFSPITLVLVAVHFAIQVCRMLYEEEILRRTFPDYTNYMWQTWRVVPYVW
jgi:protein-S-isoprenylcysteine O-methyltransferase Ste14